MHCRMTSRVASNERSGWLTLHSCACLQSHCSTQPGHCLASSSVPGWPLLTLLTLQAAAQQEALDDWWTLSTMSTPDDEPTPASKRARLHH